MDMVSEGFLTTLKKSLKEGKVTQQQIDQACRRILEAKYDLGLFANPYRFLDESRVMRDIMTDENRAAARKYAAHACVLLKNTKWRFAFKEERHHCIDWSACRKST